MVLSLGIETVDDKEAIMATTVQQILEENEHADLERVIRRYTNTALSGKWDCATITVNNVRAHFGVESPSFERRLELALEDFAGGDTLGDLNMRGLQPHQVLRAAKRFTKTDKAELVMAILPSPTSVILEAVFSADEDLGSIPDDQFAEQFVLPNIDVKGDEGEVNALIMATLSDARKWLGIKGRRSSTNANSGNKAGPPRNTEYDTVLTEHGEKLREMTLAAFCEAFEVPRYYADKHRKSLGIKGQVPGAQRASRGQRPEVAEAEANIEEFADLSGIQFAHKYGISLQTANALARKHGIKSQVARARRELPVVLRTDPMVEDRSIPAKETAERLGVKPTDIYTERARRARVEAEAAEAAEVADAV